MANQPINRRLFCKGMAIAPLLPVSTIIGIIGCATVPIYRGTLSNGRITVPQEELDRRNDENKAFVVQVSELEYPIIIVQESSDKYHALSVRCSHQGCHVRPSKNSLTCPCHGSTYDLDGKVTRGPALAPLQRFDVENTAKGITIIVPMRKL